ncbi:MAG TPA: hypothetical protein PLQ44_03520 [Candidatus Paceibacterota bacterium]|nr:hypothetical protein [Candidatus Paceibacterota bacterium]
MIKNIFVLLNLIFLIVSSSLLLADKKCSSGTVDSIIKKYKIVRINSLVFPLEQTEYVFNNLVYDLVKLDTNLINQIQKELLAIFKSNKGILIKISKYLVADNMCKIKFIEISSYQTKGIGTSADIVLSVDEKNKKVVRYGRYDFEKTKLRFNMIRERDIENYNKGLKKNKVKIQSINDALNLCLVFVNIAYAQISSEIVFDSNIVDKKIKEKILFKIRRPEYVEYPNKYFINFYCVSESGFLISFWNFEVFKNGEINLKYAKCLY